MPPRKKRRTRARPVRMVLVRGVRTGPMPRDAQGRWKSVPEEILWETYRSGGGAGRWPALNGLERQVPVVGYFLDFGLRGRKLGVEVDGLAFHGGQVEWARDHQRQRKIEHAGWRILRFTAREAAENPVGVLDEIAAAWGHGRTVV